MITLTRHHTMELADKVKSLQRELPGASIAPLDTQKAIASILASRLPVSGSERQGSEHFAYGFDLRALRSTALRDRKGAIPIQDRRYHGGYLGTGDPQNVCPEATKAFFWDMVHPTSDTHCWPSFLVQRDLVQVGLLDGRARRARVLRPPSGAAAAGRRAARAGAGRGAETLPAERESSS